MDIVPSLPAKDLSDYIIFEKLLRWKREYPSQFKNIEHGYIRANQTVLPKRSVFELCFNVGSKSFKEWLEKQEPYVRWFFQWPTNQYDIR